MTFVRSDNYVIKPNEALTREEVAFMVGKAFGVKPYQILYKEFNDSADISSWAEPFVCAMYHYGFVNGMENGVFMPKGKVTRAQVVTMLNNMVDYYISTPGAHNISGADTNVLVNCNGVTLKFNGCSTANLFVSPGVDDYTLAEDFSGCDGNTSLTEFAVGKACIAPTEPSAYPTIVFTDLSHTEIDTAFAGGKGTPDDPFLIKTQEQLKHLNNYIVGGFGYISCNYYYFKLANDITLSGNWTPIADQSIVIKMSHRVSGFYGELNGAGHTVIYSIEADDSNIQDPGLFGGLCGLVRNLNVTASITGNSNSWSGIGGIAGVLSYYFTSRGIVQNCNADITMNVSGKRICAGGIAGSSIGTISGCNAKVKINAVGTESAYAGGVVGYSYGLVDSCSSSGSIETEASKDSFAGAIVGKLDTYGEIKDCDSTAEAISK